MIDSTPAASGAVVDERPARASQPMVEADAGGQAEEASEHALAQAGQSTSSMAFQREQILAGPEDRFDALADGSQVGAASGIVPSRRTHDEDAVLGGGGGELAPGVALVADQDLAAVRRAPEELERHLAFAAGGIGERERPGRAVGSSQQMQAQAPVPARVSGAVAVAGRVCERRR